MQQLTDLKSVSSEPATRAILVACLLVMPGSVFANTGVAPFLSIKEALVENDEAGTSESGHITTLSGGVNVNRQGPKTDLSLDYALRLIENHGDLDQDDREVHLLDLAADYKHLPGKWVSSLEASSKLTSVDPNGIQNVDPDFVDDNTDELRTLSVSTRMNNEFLTTLQYQVELDADYAEFADSEDGNSTEGRGFLLGLDNFRSLESVTWSTQLDSQISEDDSGEEQIDSFDFLLNYQINTTWSTFYRYTKTESDFDFDDEANLVGLTWRPNSRSFISVGAGRRDDEDSYSLDASIQKRQVVYTASYEETITTPRLDVFEQQQSQFAQPSSQSIDIQPVLQRLAEVSAVIIGTRSTVELSAFQREREDENNLTDEVFSGLRAEFRRELSSTETISFGLFGQESDTGEDSELTDFSVGYERLLSRQSELISRFSWAEQSSSLDSSEYERILLSLEYRVTF